MPYIPNDRRQAAQYRQPETAGELNFAITTLLKRFIRFRGGISYAVLNELVGVLECVKLELYRRQIAPYEDEAKERNGDVW